MKIEKGLKMPKNIGRPRKYPFLDLEIGDSFFVKWEGCNERKDRLRINGAWQSIRLYYELNWTVRILKNGDGFRVWRIS